MASGISRAGRKHSSLSRDKSRKESEKKATEVVKAVESPRPILAQPVPAPPREEKPPTTTRLPVAEIVEPAPPAPPPAPKEKPAPAKVIRRKTPEEMEAEEKDLREKACEASSVLETCEREMRTASEDLGTARQQLGSLKKDLMARIAGTASVVAGVHPKTGEPTKLVFRDKDGGNLEESEMPPSFKRHFIMLRTAEKDLKELEMTAEAARQEAKRLTERAEQLRMKREILEKDAGLRRRSRELKDRTAEVLGDADDAAREAKEALDQFKKLGIELGNRQAGIKTMDVGRNQELLLKGEGGTVVRAMEMPPKMARRWEQYQRANRDSSDQRKAVESVRAERRTVVLGRLELRREIRSAGTSG